MFLFQIIRFHPSLKNKDHPNSSRFSLQLLACARKQQIKLPTTSDTELRLVKTVVILRNTMLIFSKLSKLAWNTQIYSKLIFSSHSEQPTFRWTASGKAQKVSLLPCSQLNALSVSVQVSRLTDRPLTATTITYAMDSLTAAAFKYAL